MQKQDLTPLRLGSPTSTSALEQRDSFLTATLRDHPLKWSYRDEYPLVLSESAAQSSYCLFEQDTIVAHASLWPRQLVHASAQKIISVALVGNVSTHPDRRGQGLQLQLFAHLANLAASQDMKALVLWSDLLEFYQKLGFSSNGRELRFVLTRRERLKPTPVRKCDAAKLTDHDLEAMMDLRPKLEWQLKRSTTEFRALLTIPQSLLFIRRSGHAITSWFIIGKGSDMAGVIHEWGAKSPRELTADLQSILAAYNLADLTILAPASAASTWLQELRTHATSVTEHPMALVRSLTGKNEAAEALARGFIWGLDSI